MFTPLAGPLDVAAIERSYADAGLRSQRWSARPGERFAAHSHGWHKALYCLRGSITFTLPDDGREIALRPGDRIDLPAGTLHSAIAGPEGCACIESAPSSPSFL